MVLNVYSIYDEKSQSYGTPFFMATDGLAARAFSDLVKDTTTLVGMHPEDFVLYQIGSFDDASAVLVSEDVPVFVVRASSIAGTLVV